jgi:hypothetical protein
VNKAIFLVDLKAEEQASKYFSFNKIASTAMISSMTGAPCAYDPEKVYNIDDKCVYVTDDGELIVIACLFDGTTGEFDGRKWEEWSVFDELKGLYNDYVIVSMERPTLRRNKIWLQITDKNAQEIIDSLGLNDNNMIIINNFIVSERRPVMNAQTIWGQITEVL